MPIKIYIIITGLLVTNLCFPQQGEIGYKTIYYDVPEVKNNKDLDIKLSREINDMRYSLRFSENESFFEILPYVPHDDFMSDMAAIVAVANNNWYQNAHTKTAFYNIEIKDSTYITIFDKRMKGWTLHNETKEIDGYTCYKATKDYLQYYTEREYIIEAWYTPEIPVPYGPIGLGGLPGLILQAAYSHVIYIVTKVSLNPKNGIKKYPPITQGGYIDEDEKHSLMRKARKVTED